MERDAPDDPEATVAGPEEAWVRTLGPGGDSSGLEVRGDRGLATELLGALTGVAARAQTQAA
jgi:hypothetical protein